MLSCKKTSVLIFKRIKAEIFSASLKDEFRESERHFTRVRKQPFSLILLLMLNLLRKSLSLEIENFWAFLKLDPLNKFTKSAFVQARMKIRPEVFKDLSDILVEEFYTDNGPAVRTWKGLRLLAVDGSRVTLPITKELKRIYGETKNQSNTTLVQARCSLLYDVENSYVLDGSLAPLAQGERALALSHLHQCRTGDLLIYDRGYPSYDLIHEHLARGLDYLMRVKTSFSQLTIDFERSGRPSMVVSIFPGKNARLSDKAYQRDTPIELRLVRVELPKGQVEILMTSLMDRDTYPDTIFKALYQKRWGIETFYDALKNKLKVEHFSGYSNQSILQDFYAALFIGNVQTLIVSELEQEIAQQNRDRKYDHKINTNLSYGLLKNRVLEIFFDKGTSIEHAIENIKKLLLKHQVPIRPNRTFARSTGKYRSRIKPKVTKNQRDTI